MEEIRKRIFPFLIIVLLIWGCSGNTRSRFMISQMKPIMQGMSMSTNRNADVETVRKAMPASLLQLDGFIEVSPDNTDVLIRAAEAYSGYAFLFVEDMDKLRAAKLHKKARNYALRALNQSQDFGDPLTCSNDEFNEALKKLTKEDARALFFATNSWLSCMGLSWKKNPEIVNDRPKILAMMDRMMELEDTFNYGAIHAMFAVYNSAPPVLLGGNPEVAKHHYDKAFEISDSKFLPWHYLYAKYYAVRIQDRELFVNTLNKIISAPENLLPEKSFANEATKEKAKRLLKKVDEFFEKDGAYLKKNLYL
jgi:hypothetical protein